MKIINPTSEEISIQYKGIVYTIPPLSSVSNISGEVATYWKTMIHEFIQVSEDVVVQDVIPEPKEVVTESKKEDSVVSKKPVSRFKK